MKKSKSLKKLKKETKNFSKLISEYSESIKEEYEKILNEKVENLLKNIAEGESLDYNYLKEKYLLKKDDSLKDELLEENNDHDLLDKIVINKEDYFYENKEDGKVYNSKAEEVGVYKDNNVILNS